MFSFLLPVIYMAFISLGLPDSLLGSAWPTMYVDLNVPISYAGIISMIIAFGTVVSSLNSDRLTKRFGAGLVTSVSVALTCVSLFGFSFSHNFYLLCVLAIPYGLGAGSVDAALNNYVALHYKSRHMSWLHCMWGIGASIGPNIMSFAITQGKFWNGGYRYIGIIQTVLTLILFLSLPQWKTRKNENSSLSSKPKDDSSSSKEVLSLKKILSIPGAKQGMFCFFCYCAVEQTAGLWAASYLTVYKGFTATQAAQFASLFYIGITLGRAINGFVTIKFTDKTLIRAGQIIIAFGIVFMFIPVAPLVSAFGFIVIGLGCAPIYPCIIHSTPQNFGKENSQAVIGVQMASAYIGTCLMPPLFGFIAKKLSIAVLPVYLILLLFIMSFMYENLLKQVLANKGLANKNELN